MNPLNPLSLRRFFRPGTLAAVLGGLVFSPVATTQAYPGVDR